MRRRARGLVGLCALVALVAALIAWHARPAAPTAPAAPGDAGPRGARVRLAELRRAAPGALAGTVRSDAGAPVASATVCARGEDAAPRCARADAHGAWILDALPPDRYAVWASAPGFGGAAWRGPPPDRDDAVTLRAGERRAGLDLTVTSGAVAVRGRVRDVHGAAVGDAELVLTRDAHGPPEATARSAPDGTFEAWARPGELSLSAAAAGYVDADLPVTAPSDGVVVTLTPGGAILGTVIDAATRAPVDDAEVLAPDGGRARTDADGRFAITGLPPGRYQTSARAIGGYGEAPSSVLVALGARVTGVVIELHPVAVVAGHVTIADTAGARPCPAGAGKVHLSRYGSPAEVAAPTLDDGLVLLEGVVPGVYGVSVRCAHYLSRVPYPDLVVRDSDIEDVTWTVAPSAHVSGVVRARDGGPIAGATVNAQSGGVTFGAAPSGPDGRFVVDGVAPGAVLVRAFADGFLRPEADTPGTAGVGDAAPVEVLLERGGQLAGTVVDERGAPIAATIRLVRDGDDAANHDDSRASRAGAFEVGPLAPGGYLVSAVLESDAPPTVRGTAVTITRGGTTTVHLVAARPSGAIDGAVIDATGAPLPDVYVTAAREEGDSGRLHTWTSGPVLTGPAGEFRFAELGPGAFTLRAYRPGGAEARALHVTLGARVTLALRPTGVLAGQVVTAGGGPATDVLITAEERDAEVTRTERAYFTGGRFELRDLPAGHYTLTVDGDPTSAQTVTLADGEERRDLQLVAQPRYTLRGRLTRAGAPLVGWKVEVPQLERSDHGPGDRVLEVSTIEAAITGDDGAFLVRNLPAGPTTISAGDVHSDGAAPITHVRDVDLSGSAAVVDLGAIPVP